MPFTAVFVASKPTETLFFGEASPENFNSVSFINNWTASQTGFVRQEGYAIDTNTYVFNITWETEEDYMNWQHTRDQLPQQIKRIEYNKTNNILVEITTTTF
jgi:heme-degrading monooxygenase HmoA